MYTDAVFQAVFQQSNVLAWRDSAVSCEAAPALPECHYSMAPFSQFRVSGQPVQNSYRHAIVNCDNQQQRYAIILQVQPSELNAHLILPSNDTQLINEIAIHLLRIFRLTPRIQVQLVEPLSDTVLLELILMMLKNGRTEAVDSAASDAKHRQLCVSALLHKQTLAAFLHDVEMVVKYLILSKRREQTFSTVTEMASGTVLKQDRALQKEIFQQHENDLNTLLTSLPIDMLAELIAVQHQQQMQLKLREKQVLYRSKALSWHSEVEKKYATFQLHFGNWLSEWLSGMVLTLYEATHVSFTGFLFEWAAGVLLSVTCLRRLYEHLWRPLLCNATVLSLSILTLSPLVIQYTKRASTQLLSLQHAPQTAKIVGILFALIATANADIGSLLYLTVTQVVSSQLHQYLCREKIDFESANVKSNEANVPSQSMILRALSFLMMAVASYQRQDVRYLSYGVVGVLMSVFWEKIGVFYLNHLKKELPLSHASRQVVRYGLSMLGLYAGQLFLFYCFAMNDKLNLRKMLESELSLMNKQEQNGFAYIKACFPSVLYTPSMWFSDYNPVTLFWGNKTGFWAECEIYQNHSSGVAEVECQSMPTKYLLAE